MNHRHEKLPDRGMLRLDRIDEFAAWAETQGFGREAIPHSAIFQILRLYHAKRGLFVFHKKAGEQIYASCEQKCRPLIREWLRSTLAPYPRGFNYVKPDLETSADVVPSAHALIIQAYKSPSKSETFVHDEILGEAISEAEAEIMRTAHEAFEKHGRKMIGSPEPAHLQLSIDLRSGDATIEVCKDEPGPDKPAYTVVEIDPDNPRIFVSLIADTDIADMLPVPNNDQPVTRHKGKIGNFGTP